MKSTCVLIIVCAMNVSFSRFNNPPLGGFFCGCVGCFSVGAWGVFLWVRGVFFCGRVGCFSVGALVRGVVGVLCFLWGCGGL